MTHAALVTALLAILDYVPVQRPNGKRLQYTTLLLPSVDTYPCEDEVGLVVISVTFSFYVEDVRRVLHKQDIN